MRRARQSHVEIESSHSMEVSVNSQVNSRSEHRRGVAPANVVRRGLACIAALLAALAGVAGLAGPASAATVVTPRIDLKVLLLGTSATEPDFVAWQGALQREGVKFDAVTGTANTGVTAATLSTTLADGTPEAKYDAVIVSVGGLTDCTTTCTSYLTPAEQTALEQYEHRFNIRQITGNIYPGATYGLNTPTISGALDTVQGTLTADGQSVFSYLKPTAAITMDTGTYGYEATPVSTTNFDTLVGGPNGSALVGVYTHTDGVQEMVQTFNQNANQLQSQLLRHGAITWATRGVFFGDQRNYLETHIDDVFLGDDPWSVAGNATTAAHSTDYNPADALRLVPADVTTAANWAKANNFRIDLLFNGGGSVAVANGSSLVGSGDGGSGTSGTTGTTGGTATGNDPLLAAFTGNNPATGKPYTGDFAWISHTWDHPNIDEGCATQNYIEAELNQNTNWGGQKATGGDSLTGGLGLTESTDPTVALGNDNPNVVVTGEHSGLANLLPGNPGQVDPPSLDDATVSATGGTLAAGDYVYAVTDQFNTAAPGATPVAGTGMSAASETTTPVTVTGATGSVSLTWGAVCHAADYKVYRAPDTAGAIGAWSLIGTVGATTATDFANPASTTDTTGGGAVIKTFTDTGIAGANTGSTGAIGATTVPASEGTAVESPYEQNPVLDAAFAATLSGGIKDFGADASKPYPNAADQSFATGSAPSGQYTSGASFQDAGATGIPRYPTNIYYNVATAAQEVDEYETLYDSAPAAGGSSTTPGHCTPIAGVTTCNPAGTAFTISQIVASVDQGMFQHLMGNDARPSYFHQTNLMSQTNGGANGSGDGLFYQTLNPLLAEYHAYFADSAPIVQLTMAQIGTLLSEQAAWAANTSVSGYVQGNQVTITNSGTTSVQAPLSGLTTVGSSYGGTQSGWTALPAGSSTYTAAATWPVDTIAVALAPASIVANGATTSTATATLTADGKPVSGDVPVFASSDTNDKIGAVTDNQNGTYTAVITSSTTAGPATITATDAAVSPTASGTATLNQTAGALATVAVTLSPASIAANGTSTSTVSARLTDALSHAVPGEHVGFSSTDPGEKIGAVTDHGDGTYTATVTASATVGTATITATDSSVSPSASGTAKLVQTAGPATASAVTLSPASIIANGTATSAVTAKVTDAQGHAEAGQHVAFSSSDPGEKISAVTDHGDGTYTATITSSTTAGSPTITATDSSVSPSIAGTAKLIQVAAPTVAPATKPTDLTPPSISGPAIVGRVLQATAGTWSGTAPIAYAYQWQSCARTCSGIAGATRSTYTLTRANRGRTVKVVVTASNAAGTAQATSAATGPVAAAVSPAQMRTLLARLTPAGGAARIPALLRHGGYAARVTAPANGRLVIAWYARHVLVAHVTATVRNHQITSVRITLTAAGRRRLRGAPKLQLRAAGRLVQEGAGTVSAVRTFVVTR